MTIRFDTKSGEFVDDREEEKPVFILRGSLSGDSPPDETIGEDGDFYINTSSWTIYGPKSGGWGEPTVLIGKQGDPGESVKGDKGDDGDSIKGDPGESIRGDQGIGIANIAQDGLSLLVTLDNGTIKTFEIPSPLKGNDGTGIVGIKTISAEKIEIILSDGKSYVVDLPAGKDGKEIELRRHLMMVQWRYIGEEWKDLFPIPPITSGSGGAGVYELIRLTDVHITNLQNGQTLVWSVADNKWINSTASSGGHTIQDEGTPLTQRTNLNFVGSAVAATDDAGNDATVVTINNPTTIVGISGTKAEFDTACTDGNFLYVGDVVGVTDGDKGDITVSGSGTVWTVDVAPAGTLTGATLAANVLASSLTSVGTLTGGATGAGFTIALGTSTLTGDLPFANLAQGSALSVLGVTGNAIADNASIVAASDFQVLRRSGTAVAFGAIDLSQAAATTGTLPIASVAAGFVKVDGTTPLTANWDVGTFEVRANTFQSDVATGTAPLIVASTTLVTNFNADSVDGKHVGTSGNTIPLLDGTNTFSALQTITSTTLATTLDLSRTFTVKNGSVATLLAFDTLNWSASATGVIHSVADLRVIDTSRTVTSGANEHIHVINAAYTGAVGVTMQSLTILAESGLFLMADGRTYDRSQVNQTINMQSVLFGPSSFSPLFNNALSGSSGRTINYTGASIWTQTTTVTPTCSGDATDTVNFAVSGMDHILTAAPVLNSGTLNIAYYSWRARQAVMPTTGNSALYVIFNALSGADIAFCLANNSASHIYQGYDGTRVSIGTNTNTTSSGIPATAMVEGDVYYTYDSTSWLFEHSVVASGAAFKFNSTLVDVDFEVYSDDGIMLHLDAGAGTSHFTPKDDLTTAFEFRNAAGTAKWTFDSTNSQIVLADAVNIVLNATTGTKIGTATSQKIGIWNAAPIAQPTTAIAAATFVANTSGIANDTATWDGYTMGQVVKALRNFGALA